MLAAAFVLFAGLLLCGLGWVLGQGFLAKASLLVALVGGLGLWHQGVRFLHLAQEHQAFLKALNESLDEQVQARTQRLMQTIEDLESFNRMVTHDLKSPLSGLVLGMEMLEAQVEKIQDSELQARVKTLSDCVGRWPSSSASGRTAAAAVAGDQQLQTVRERRKPTRESNQLADDHRPDQWGSSSP